MSTENYIYVILSPHKKCLHRFVNLQKLGTEYDTVSSPFATHFEKAPDVIQLELIDLQRDSTLKEKFQSEGIDKFYAL